MADRMTVARLSEIDAFVASILNGERSPSEEGSTLLVTTLACLREVRECWKERGAPRNLTAEQAKLLFEAERELITSDYHGKDAKQQVFRKLVMSLLGWTAWPEA